MPPVLRRTASLPPSSTGGIFTARFSPSGAHLLTGGADRQVRLWSRPALAPLLTLSAHAYQVLSATFSPSGLLLASCGVDRSVFLWSPESATLLAKLSGRHGHQHRVNDVAFAGAADSLLVSASYDASVRVWDIRSRAQKPVQILADASDAVTAVVAREGSAEIIAASVDGRVRVYDVRKGNFAVDSLGAPVVSVAVSRDGRRVLAACLDDQLRLLDKESGELVEVYAGHSNRTYAVRCAVSADDIFVVSGSEGGGFCVWDMTDGNRPVTYGGREGGEGVIVAAVDAHPKEIVFVSAGHDGSVELWTAED